MKSDEVGNVMLKINGNVKNLSKTTFTLFTFTFTLSNITINC